jgi:hypothetical protein
MVKPVPIIILPILLVVAAPIVFYSFMVFDRLVRAQYEGHREAWIASGRPRGFFWSAPECSWLGSAYALHRASVSWLFKTPSWAASSSIYLRWLRRFRLSVLLWNVIVMGTFIAVAVTLT